MEYDEAKTIGDAGERAVAEVLRDYCVANPPSGFLSNRLLSVGTMTAQLDLVLVDPAGILIVEVKVRHALIRGNADEHKWTAVYQKAHKTFQNPLEQLRGQRNALSQTLRKKKDPIDLDLIQGVVVFVDADIHALELDSETRSRVTTLQGLPNLLAQRAAATPPCLSHQEITHRFEQLQWVDNSANAGVQSHHAEYRGGASRPGVTAPSLPAGETRPAQRPCATLSANPYRAAAPPKGSVRSVTRDVGWSRPRLPRKLVTFLLQLAFFGLFYLCMVSGVFTKVVSMAVVPAINGFSQASLQGTTQQSATASPALARAQQALRTAAPSIYPEVTDMSSPGVAVSGDATTFTWHYLDKTSKNAVTVRTCSVTLGPDGALRAHMP